MKHVYHVKDLRFEPVCVTFCVDMIQYTYEIMINLHLIKTFPKRRLMSDQTLFLNIFTHFFSHMLETHKSSNFPHLSENVM